MRYTCWLIIETLRELTLGAMHLAHAESMIEKCRRTLTALWVVSFSLSSSFRPRESSSLPFIWFSWVGAPCLVNPILISPSFVSQHRSFPTPREPPKKWPPWPRFTHVPAGYPRGQRLVSHHLSPLPSPPPSSTVRQTATTPSCIHTYNHIQRTYKYIWASLIYEGTKDEVALQME